MAENKKTFIFYSDWINMVREMPDKDAGELIKHVLSYVNDESPATDNILVKMAFGHMEPMLKADLVKWETQLKKYSDMGKLSAEKRKKQHKSTYVEPTLTQVEPRNTVNDNVNVNVNEKVIKVSNIEERKRDFTKSLTPYLDEFGKDTLNNFFEYWTEHGESDKKMRFEKEKSFGLSRRLTTWKKNDKKFAKSGSGKSNFPDGYILEQKGYTPKIKF